MEVGVSDPNPNPVRVKRKTLEAMLEQCQRALELINASDGQQQEQEEEEEEEDSDESHPSTPPDPETDQAITLFFLFQLRYLKFLSVRVSVFGIFYVICSHCAFRARKTCLFMYDLCDE